MKSNILIGLIALVAWACSPVKEVSKTSAKLTQDSQDSTQYEIQIIDPYFDQWYQINYIPAKDHSNEYYRSKNQEAVVYWNEYYRSGKYSRVVDCSIDFQPNIDYGMEVNRKLYYYFKYVQDKYKVKLFSNAFIR